MALIGTLIATTNGYSAELSNDHILGAIPQSFDNVGIIRYEDLDADTEVGDEFLRETPPGSNAPSASTPLDAYIAQELRTDGLAVSVIALSTQDVSPTMEYSGRNIFRLYVSEENTEDLKLNVMRRDNVQQVDHLQFEIYRDDSSANPVYVGFIDETAVLITNSQEDLVTASIALQAPDAQEALNWSMLDDVDIQAPILILRRLQYPIITPDANVPREDNFMIGMWIADTSQPIFQLEVASALDRDAAHAYITTVGGIDMLSGPEGISLRLEDRSAEDGNYTGTLELIHNEMGDHYTDLAFHWLLGIWFAI